MKLNLLPTSASRGSGSRFAWVLCVIIIGVSIFLSFSMKSAGEKALQGAKDDVSNNQSDSQRVVDTSALADATMLKASGPLLNVRLATEMMEHNKVYPDFYDEVLKCIPGYFRLTSLQATPIDGGSCTVTMTGTISSFQQYADLMLALLRIKGAAAVSRSGYQVSEAYVPNLIETDQKGNIIYPGHQRLVDNDPMGNLDMKIAEAGHTGFAGAGNFGVPGMPMQRGASPKESLITVAVVVNKDLMTPNPRETLSTNAAAFGPAGGGVTISNTSTGPSLPGGPGGGGMPGGPGRPPGLPGAPGRPGGSR